MKRYNILQEISRLLEDQIVVCNIGIPSKELYHLKDRNENFYMLGSMGLVSSIALGIAIAKPDKKIWCIDGDGSLLMNLGSLSTIAYENPQNLTLIVIDNHAYGSTGNQETHTKYNTKLDEVAIGCGFTSVNRIRKKEQIEPILSQLDEGNHFILIEAEPGNKKLKNISLSPKHIKERFIKALNR
ncbi:MAG: sulfopyruvate decarboxylase subunit beta [Candidatus Lokiarchaeota archaeon]